MAVETFDAFETSRINKGRLGRRFKRIKRIRVQTNQKYIVLSPNKAVLLLQ